MTNELQTLNERIAERIGKDLVSLIPEDQWQEIVDKEIHNFKLVVAPKIIKELLTEAYKERAKKEVSALLITDEYNELTNEYINKALTKLLADSGGIIFAGMMQPAMQMVLQDLRSRLGY